MMKLNIEHSTRYAFNKPVAYTIQQLRLTPQDGFGQRVSNWHVKVSGKTSPQIDAFGNATHTLVMDSPHQEIIITASGEVETDIEVPVSPVIRPDDLALPVYLRHTRLTQVNEEIRQFAHGFLPQGQIIDKDLLMALMNGISQTVKWTKDADDSQQSAIDALSSGKGLSQGLAHLFIACCRVLKVPARFVHGYCFSPVSNQLENHSWADAWLVGAGWQSFDVANNVPSNGVHVRLATGLDYRDACPISSVMRDIGHQQMSVSFKVQEMSKVQQQVQQQVQQ
ncbi:transglutaminase family protein [Methylotenera sp.]|uniref:transglutaminase family protein n=1 Tax=Methylotenera sp. TaxID=2051956 RepID=UPI00272FD6B3|nr:transglutaminase family protein [Methylotenera sp.]MDP2229331.1 transglutaminase family protein [Methylotenera sp.]MDP3141905.1 transglutaminase family protein [Methylotenera sp.]MDP3308375.1 transglutaminase family protein [Methylotenera sp.]